MLKLNQKLVALLLLAILLAGCQGLVGRPSKEEAATPTPIPTPIVPEKPTYVVQRGEMIRKLEFTGRVAPVQKVELSFRTNGHVRVVWVKKGDPVKQGDILAELEMAELERSLAQAQLDLQTAQLSLAQAEQDHQYAIARARIDLAIRQLQLQKAPDLTPRKAQAEADLAQARLALQ